MAVVEFASRRRGRRPRRGQRLITISRGRRPRPAGASVDRVGYLVFHDLIVRAFSQNWVVFYMHVSKHRFSTNESAVAKLMSKSSMLNIECARALMLTAPPTTTDDDDDGRQTQPCEATTYTQNPTADLGKLHRPQRNDNKPRTTETPSAGGGGHSNCKTPYVAALLGARHIDGATRDTVKARLREQTEHKRGATSRALCSASPRSFEGDGPRRGRLHRGRQDSCRRGVDLGGDGRWRGCGNCKVAEGGCREPEAGGRASRARGPRSRRVCGRGCRLLHRRCQPQGRPSARRGRGAGAGRRPRPRRRPRLRFRLRPLLHF